MSREYPCVYYDNEKCTLHGSDPEHIDWCVMGPCSHETPSNADHIRSMSDEDLARFLAEVENRRSAAGGGAIWKGAAHALEWLRQPVKEEPYE